MRVKKRLSTRCNKIGIRQNSGEISRKITMNKWLRIMTKKWFKKWIKRLLNRPKNNNNIHNNLPLLLMNSNSNSYSNKCCSSLILKCNHSINNNKYLSNNKLQMDNSSISCRSSSLSKIRIWSKMQRKFDTNLRRKSYF